MSSANTLTFTLKQHTALIHFHDQDEALIRATELKPKLDRHLVTVMGGADIAKEKFKPWILSYNSGGVAFDYKIKISSFDVERRQILEGANNRIPFYFGNLGREYLRNPKYLCYTSKPVTITITSFNFIEVDNETLLEFITSIISTFFLKENFGTRQSKGYGSFYLHPDDQLYENPQEIISFQNEETKEFLPYSFSLTNETESSFDAGLDVLRKLEIFYKAMRSGINICYGRNQHYLKSLIWVFYKQKIDTGLKWEKKKIKEHFLGNHSETARQKSDHSSDSDYKNSPLGSNGSNEILIKDLFGLASKETWKAKYDFEIEKVITDIDRFKSPIFFKPISTVERFNVFFHSGVLNTDNSILDKTITINDSLKMRTPAKFDFHDFFNFLSDPKEFKLDKHITFLVENEETGNIESMTVSDIKAQGSKEYNRSENYTVLHNIITQLQSKSND